MMCRSVRKEQLCKGKGYCNQPAERIRMAPPWNTEGNTITSTFFTKQKPEKTALADPRPTK